MTRPDMARPTTHEPPRRPSAAPSDIAEPDRTQKAAKHTRHIRIRGFGESQDEALFVLLGFRHLGVTKMRLLPVDNLTPTSKDFSQLNIDGARLISPQARSELINRIQATVEDGPRFKVATRLGWHDKHFVLPDGVISASGKKLWVHLDDGGRRERFDRYRVGGTLEGFLELARLAVGNSLMELGLCVAFSGPVAALLGVEQPGVMLVGPPGSWKSTLLATVASVWGRHLDPNMANKLGFCVPFNATDNDLEDEALAANHTLLAVDETRAAGRGGERKVAEFLVDLVMRWDSGFEKGRKTAPGARRSASVPFLLTSNKGLGALAALAEMEIDDAHHGRLIGVPLPGFGASVFEDLHGAADDAAFGEWLRRLIAEHFGRAAREFLRRLAEWRARDEAGLLKWLKKHRQIYLDVARPRIDALGRQLDRVHEKFATLYAVCCLGIKFGLLPWEQKRLIKTLLSCTRGHVALVAREQADVTRWRAAPLDLLRDYVRLNQDEFIDLRRGGIEDTSSHDHRACPGYINEHEKHGLELLFSDQRFQEIVGGAAAAKRLKAELAQAGQIATTAGTGSDRYSVRRTIGKHADGTLDRRQVIAVRAAAFDSRP